MNDKIKELAEQATTVMVPKSGDHAGMEFHCFDKEKFAELIVRECIGTISEVKERFFKFRLEADDFTEKNKFFAGEDACNQSVQKIETLFGVE